MAKYEDCKKAPLTNKAMKKEYERLSSNPQLYVMAGLPGSGKSSLAKQIAEECNEYHKNADDGHKAVVVSSDDIRAELFGDAKIQGDPAKVFAEMRRLTAQAFDDGNDVIYDACNISSKKRRALLKSFPKFQGEKICVICATPYYECLVRNLGRDRVVPNEAIKRMYMNWYTPYYFEGWDEIRVHYADDTAKSFGPPEDYAKHQLEFSQDNPYHMETLGEHLLLTQKGVLSRLFIDEKDNLSIAALIHDCGKPFTKGFFSAKGDPTDVAHYYQHQCVGAYDALFFDKLAAHTRD